MCAAFTFTFCFPFVGFYSKIHSILPICRLLENLQQDQVAAKCNVNVCVRVCVAATLSSSWTCLTCQRWHIVSPVVYLIYLILFNFITYRVFSLYLQPLNFYSSTFCLPFQLKWLLFETCEANQLLWLWQGGAKGWARVGHHFKCCLVETVAHVAYAQYVAMLSPWWWQFIFTLPTAWQQQ